MTFLLFTVFSSLRVVSYLPQIRKVALDTNGATAISYSTWSLWTCANVATALYAGINLQNPFLSTVSSIYAICCIVVICITLFKRRHSGIASAAARSRWVTAVSQRDAASAELRANVSNAAAALTAGRRPDPAFEKDLAAQARRMLWHDIAATFASVAHRPSRKARAT